MNHIMRPTFLVGVLLWTAFFFIGPIPLENIARARAQPAPPGQLCPPGYVSTPIPQGMYSPCPSCDHVCTPPNPVPPAPYIGGNHPYCEQYPCSAGCPCR